MELFEETLSSRELYSGKIITLRKDMVRLENGAQALREVVVHPGGVCVLALEEDNTTYVVRQFRYPFGQVTTELPAGKLDGPEDPEAAARRELSEEVGVEAESLVYLSGMLASPGFCTEVLHIYLARGLHKGISHPDEDEFLAPQRLPLSELYEKVLSGEITDMKSACAVLKVVEYLRRNGYDPLVTPPGAGPGPRGDTRGHDPAGPITPQGKGPGPTGPVAPQAKGGIL